MLLPCAALPMPTLHTPRPLVSHIRHPSSGGRACHRPQGGGAVGVLKIDGVVATGGARGHRVEARLVGESHRAEDELVAERERREWRRQRRPT